MIVHNMARGSEVLLIGNDIVKECLQEDVLQGTVLVEQALWEHKRGQVIQPTKSSLIFDERTQDRINCMPAALPSQGFAGVKWVSVFPNNPRMNLPNVAGYMLLSDTSTGSLLSILDASYLTSFRTACVGATAAKYLARQDSQSIGFIGSGEEALAHLDVFSRLFPGIRKCFVSSRRATSTRRFVALGQAMCPDMRFFDCKDDYHEAVKDADIIVTAISAQLPLLKARSIKRGATYIHVGGWEDEYAVAQKADKIVCDSWDAIKHRGSPTLGRMYADGLLCDDDVYCELEQLVCDKVIGRHNADEFIYFNSVGMSFIDVQFARYIYTKCVNNNLGNYVYI